MIYLAQRILRQGLPWGVVILSIGLGRQYAAGAGAFEPESGWLTQAQTAIAQLRAALPEFVPTTEENTEPSAEAAIAAPPPSRPLTPVPPAFPRCAPQYFGGPGNCRH